MEISSEIISILDKTEYIFLRGISEPRDNSLRLIVQEGVVNRSEGPSVRLPDHPLYSVRAERPAFPVESTASCWTAEVYWERYLAYLVTEEIAASGGFRDDEVYSGKFLRIYAKSHFLDYISRYMVNIFDSMQHYQLNCENHVIDVASYGPPEIRLLNPQSFGDEAGTKPS